jgi:uncharacterized Zn finger protein
MPTRRLKKVPTAVKPTGSVAGLRKALARRRKDELVAIVMELASNDRRLLGQLTSRFEVAVPPKELVGATRQAIANATDFDDRDANHNFDYDDDAYIEVRRNLKRLLDLDQLPAALELALELMKEGSHQVEMSDEGLMTDDIEECLTVVIKALGKSNLPTGDVLTWCSAMLKNDRVGFICEGELKSLRQHVEASTS